MSAPRNPPSVMDPIFCAEWCRHHGGPPHAVHVSGPPCTRQPDHDGDCENWYAQQSWPCPHDPTGTSPYACACEDG